MIPPITIVEVENDVRTHLEKLGLRLESLQEILKHISGCMNNYTEDHPSWGPGITTASEAVYAMRTILREDGWQKEETNGFSLTVRSDGKVALNIAKGDDGTGNSAADMATVSSKGICTKNAISQNQLQFDLPIPLVSSAEAREVWYLVYAKKSDGIHAEISLPFGMSDSDQIANWRIRIILPLIREDEFENQTSGFDDGGFEIQLARK